MVAVSPRSIKTLPFLQGYPLAGNIFEFNGDRLNFLRRVAALGDIAGVHFGPFPALLFNKPEHIQSIFVEHAYDFDKGDAIHSSFRPPIGDGIFSSEGGFHRHQRKLMAPSFQPRHIASYAENMGHYGELVQQSWSDGSIVDINQQMTALTMSVIGKALFDADVFTETGELGAAMSISIGYISHTLSLVFPPPYAWPLPRNQRTRKAVQVLRNYIQGFINDRRSKPDDTRSDFLSLLLNARDDDGQPMSDNQLMSECLTLFGAGHETTAAALTWTWYLLSQHPEAYERVFEEVDRVLQGRTPTYADLVKLPYCLQVFKETLRLYPPAYIISRRAVRDVVIDGYAIGKNYSILVAPYTMHRRAELFPDPERFDPERFLPEREKQLPRYAFMPFGAGPRICIGMHFSMMEGHLLLAALAQRVRLTLVPAQTIHLDLVHNLTLRPNGPVQMTVQRR